MEGDNRAERAEPPRQHRTDNGRAAESQADNPHFKLFGGHKIALPSLMASTKAPAAQILPRDAYLIPRMNYGDPVGPP